MSTSVITVRRRVAAVAAIALLLTAVAGTASAQNAGSGDETGYTPIYEIQGAGHLSPFAGQEVTTRGVVTTVGFNFYYVQDPEGDGDVATSDGMNVFQPGPPSARPEVGECVELTDTVEEFIPGGAGTGNLSTTNMAFADFTVIDPCGDIPEPVVIGLSGRVPPPEIVISDDELPTNLQTDPAVYDPDEDAIDFYESLEGMLVTVESPQAVSAVRQFTPFSGEFFTVPNNGAPGVIEPDDALTERGGILLQPDPDNRGDQNPERVQIQLESSIDPPTVFPPPPITVGDQLTDITGVVGYSFGNYEVIATAGFAIDPSGLQPETSELTSTRSDVTVASYNVLNLAPTTDDDAQRQKVAGHIVDNLNAPDVVALQEIQDNNGEIDDGTTDATETLQALVDAIEAAGGPTYEFFDVAPADGASGGIPGGNIRNAFLYQADRVKLVDFRSLTPDVLAELDVSDPDAFDGTRDPLLATFKYRGKEFTVVNNHLTSRFGSTPIFGGPQPFVQAGEEAREAQTTALNEVVDALLAAARGNADRASKAGRILVVGDLNTFEWTNDLAELLPGTGAERVLTNLVPTLDEDAYTFIFDGNSQALDHAFVTDNLLDDAAFDIVHVNVDFPRRLIDVVGSDHEPLLVSVRLKP